MESSMKFLKELTETPGVPGREELVRELIKKRTKGWWNSLYEDPVGNLIGFIPSTTKGKSKSVIIACHLDQIGFYVRTIDSRGFLRIQQAGGFDTRNLFARRVRIMARSGEIVGILNPTVKPVHIATTEERNKIPAIAEFFIDTGMQVSEVKRKIAPGDPIVIEQNTSMVGEMICGQSMDNRISPWVGLNAIRKSRGKNKYNIYWLGSAQEEVGLRGATVAGQNIAAEIAIAIDVTLAMDTPGTSSEDTITKLGDGVAIKIMDMASISTKSLIDEFVQLAKRKKIKYQHEILPLGGTDAAALQRFGPGRRIITLSIPCRYVHTAVETVHRKDLDAAVSLLSAWLSKKPTSW